MNRTSDYIPLDNSRVNETPIPAISKEVKRNASDLLREIRDFQVRKYREDPSRGSSNGENEEIRRTPIDRSQLQEKTIQQNPSILVIKKRSNRKSLKLLFNGLSSGKHIKISGNNLPLLKFYCEKYQYMWNGEIGNRAIWFRRTKYGSDNYAAISPFTDIVPDYNPELTVDDASKKIILKPFNTSGILSRIREIFL